MKVPFIKFGQNYLNIKTEIDEAIQRTLSNGDLILRKDVEEFEESFAKYVGTKYCVALNSGTDALYLALKAIGIKPGNRVLVPSHTFVATVQVVNQVGAIPIVYDMDIPSYGGLVHAYVASHIAGELSPIPELSSSQVKTVPVIEDACQALGALKNPTSAAQAWSFYPAKTLGCYGDGGALTTNDEQVYNYVKEARNHFKTDYSEWGINSRLDNVQAAILNVKLKYLPIYLETRKQWAERYDKGLKGVGLPKVRDVYQDYIIQTPKRDELYDFLKERGIETMKNEYPMPIGKLPRAQKFESEGLRLPVCPENTAEEIDYVIETINTFTDLQS
jgi:dTDP-4-amino-4,6-dideoxygalactose transaminase